MKAKRRLGQNFLVDGNYQERIVASARPVSGETIVEIGPGFGALTKRLVASGANVIAVELDRELAAELQKEFSSLTNFRLVIADALEVDFSDLIAPATTARVVANLPYYISTPIISHLIEFRGCLPEMILMLQREVVERIVAKPGGKEYGYFSVIVQFYCDAQKLFDVPPTAFKPRPKVYSSVVRLTARKEPPAQVRSEGNFIKIAQTIFAHRRKTLLNNLKAGAVRLALQETVSMDEIAKESGIDLGRRAETLSIQEIARLADACQNAS